MGNHGAEALLVFRGRQERADHRVLSRPIAQRRTVHLAEPEQQSANVPIALQVAKVLRGHKCPVGFGIDECPVVGWPILPLPFSPSDA